MTYQFDTNRPIYLQVMEDVKNKIASKEYRPGDKIQPVRELASVYEVNPNTVQKALAELERENIVYSKRTSGRYITEDQEIISNLINEMVNQRINTFINDMNNLGYSKQDIIDLLERKIC